MNIYIPKNANEINPSNINSELEKLGHQFTELPDADIIFNFSIVTADLAEASKVKFPNKKLINFCWDFYKWAYEGKHPYHNWIKYADQLRKSDLVLVPSSTQKLRLKEMLDIDSVVVKTGVEVYDYEAKDERFVLMPVRYYPEENEKWAEKACEELGIPYIHSEHQYNKEEFRKLVNTCTFMVCAYREASTGGLSLIEGLYNGVPSLTSNSPYQGAKDYLGEFGHYFQYNDYEDLKNKIKEMWEKRPIVNKTKARKYIQNELSFKSMAEKIDKLICELLKK